MRKLHTYRYLQCVVRERGHKYRLRRDDGKLVEVSRKRFNQLGDRKQIQEQQEQHPNDQT